MITPNKMEIVRKALSEEEVKLFTMLVKKVEDYQKTSELVLGDKLRNKNTDEIVTFMGRETKGFGQIYVSNFTHPVYEENYEKIIPLEPYHD